MNLNELNSFEKIMNLINIKRENECNYINNYFEIKREKIMNYIYELSLLRDKQIDKISDVISKKHLQIEQARQQLEFKLEDEQITQQQYDYELNNLLEQLKNGINKKIEILNKKIEKKSSKWNTLIDKKRSGQKEKISQLNLKNEKMIEECKKCFSNLEDKFNSTKSYYENLDENEQIKILNSIEHSSVSKKINKLNIDRENKKIGPKSFEKEILKNEAAKSMLVEDINKNHKADAYLKGKRKVNAKTALLFSGKQKFTNRLIFSIDSSKLIIIIMLIAVIVGVIQPVFFSTRNWKLIFLQNADLLCLAIGVSIVILTGGIDLSIGSTLAFASALVAKLIVDGYSVYIAIIVLIGFCLISGLISGVLVSWLKLPPFIVTLVMMLIWRGATYVLLENKVVPVQNDILISIASFEVLGIPLPVILSLVLALVTFIILKFTVYGRSIYAVGGNYKASELSGIKSKMILASVYVFASLCFAMGSLLYISRIRVATPTTGNAWELDAIACVVLGGTALTGGKGGILQTVMGWFVMSVLKNALVIVGLDTNVQSIVKGVVILVAILSQSNYGIIRYIIKKMKLIKYYLLTT